MFGTLRSGSFSPLQGLCRLVPPGRNVPTKDYNNYRKGFRNVSCHSPTDQEGGHLPFSRMPALVALSNCKRALTLSNWPERLSRSPRFLSFCFTFRRSPYKISKMSRARISEPSRILRQIPVFCLPVRSQTRRSWLRLNNRGCWGNCGMDQNLHLGMSQSLSSRV